MLCLSLNYTYAYILLCDGQNSRTGCKLGLLEPTPFPVSSIYASFQPLECAAFSLVNRLIVRVCCTRIPSTSFHLPFIHTRSHSYHTYTKIIQRPRTMKHSSPISLVIALCICTLTTVHASPYGRQPCTIRSEEEDDPIHEWREHVSHDPDMTNTIDPPRQEKFTEEQTEQFNAFERAYLADKQRDRGLKEKFHPKISLNFGSKWKHDLTGYDQNIVRVFRILHLAGQPRWSAESKQKNGMTSSLNSLGVTDLQ